MLLWHNTNIGKCIKIARKCIIKSSTKVLAATRSFLIRKMSLKKKLLYKSVIGMVYICECRVHRPIDCIQSVSYTHLYL